MVWWRVILRKPIISTVSLHDRLHHLIISYLILKILKFHVYRPVTISNVLKSLWIDADFLMHWDRSKSSSLSFFFFFLFYKYISTFSLQPSKLTLESLWQPLYNFSNNYQLLLQKKTEDYFYKRRPLVMVIVRAAWCWKKTDIVLFCFSDI